MLVYERRRVVDLVVNDHEQIFLGVVGGDFLEGEFLRHFESGVVVLVGVCTEIVMQRAFLFSIRETEYREEVGAYVIQESVRIWSQYRAS